MNKILEKIKKDKWIFIIGLMGVLLIVISLLCQPAPIDTTTKTLPENESPTRYEQELTGILKQIDGIEDVHMLITEKGAVIIITANGDSVLKEKVTKAATCVLGIPSNKIFIEFN
jgi:hypothetical protein